ncbi:IS3 family transposase [Bacillus sp. P1(2020)]|uniref:IS3 family transposase n=1 Tax=Pallidibacillus pasinlerensis TaxID=2703818 RepID=A0ABX0A4Y8_9BACI|nr:IS3 family transposase [Pallidibacillus pasinlerensis]
MTRVIAGFNVCRPDIYGQRKIKKELEKQGKIVSLRRIGRMMKEQGLVSKYTVAQYKPRLVFICI